MGRAAQVGTDYANAVLASPWAKAIDRWLRGTIDAKATAVSRAMDAEYLRTGVGGGWHRLFDGGHDLWGAWNACKSATPEDALLERIGIYAAELWKDLATPNGLPVPTWDKQTFDAVAAGLKDALGVSPDWVRDMATFTATELGGGVVALGALLLNVRSNEPERYLELCGSLGVSALVAANPLLVAVWIAAVLHGAYANRRLLRWRSAEAVVRGGLVSGAGVLTVVLFGPAGLLLAVPVMLGVRLALRRLLRGRRRLVARRSVAAIGAELRALPAHTRFAMLPPVSA